MAKKNNIVKVLATLCLGAVAAGSGLASVSASASATLGGVDVSSFRMEYGANVRFNTEDGKNGIRFTATMDASAYNALEALELTDGAANGNSVNYGVIIVPADLYSASVLTVENIFGSEKYCLENSEECECAKTHLASVKYETLAKVNEVMTLRGSLVDVLSSNLTREFTGIGYIEYATSTGTNYVLAGAAYGKDGTGEADMANNTRSMTYVAQKAIVAGEDENDTLLTDYVTPLADKEFKYTVNHYLPDAEGEYGAPVTETAYGKLNEAVTAANIAKSTLTNKSEYATYATYGTATTSNASDIVYANGRTQLNLYYEERNTVLFDGSDAEDFANVTTAFNNSALNEGVATVTNGESYTDANSVAKNNVTKIVLDGENQTYGSGYLKFAFDDDKIALANSANWDYLTVTMCVTTTASNTSFNMYSWNAPFGSVKLNEWVDFVIPKSAMNVKKSYVIGAKDPQDKAGFDACFEKEFAVSNVTPDSYATNYHTLFYTNTLKKTETGTNVTYYIEKITWGVDVEAPEISTADISKSYAGTFNPTVTVVDDYNTNPTVSKTVYGVAEDGAREEVAADESGAWNLPIGNYVLVVSANDGAVTDMVGNVTTKEIPFETIENPARPAGYLTDFDIPSEIGYVCNNNANVTTTTSWLDSYEGKTGVLKFETSMVSNTQYGAYFYLNFSDEMIEEIWTAYNDSTTEFTFTLSMWVYVESPSTSDYDTCGVSLYNGQGKKYSHTVTNADDSSNKRIFSAGKWEDFTFSESEMESIFGWVKADSLSTTSNFYKQMKGTVYLFYLGYPTCAKSSKVTYYVDGISYSTTSIES